jgi:hypothetical protein
MTRFNTNIAKSHKTDQDFLNKIGAIVYTKEKIHGRNAVLLNSYCVSRSINAYSPRGRSAWVSGFKNLYNACLRNVSAWNNRLNRQPMGLLVQIISTIRL